MPFTDMKDAKMPRTRTEIAKEIFENKTAIAIYDDMLSSPYLMNLAEEQGLPIRENKILCQNAVRRLDNELKQQNSE
ncbi:MAG: hypothetical protein LBI19_02515 [Oscillospiraceae bacterium]|jgi:hypothetical protein|nr:hypothetical protein [Oscillospiraceae bacterium]